MQSIASGTNYTDDLWVFTGAVSSVRDSASGGHGVAFNSSVYPANAPRTIAFQTICNQFLRREVVDTHYRLSLAGTGNSVGIDRRVSKLCCVLVGIREINLSNR